jgi:hypothetical protein
MTSLNARIAETLRRRLAGPKPVDEAALNDMLRLLMKWRHLLISNTQIQLLGNRVMAGPFMGMEFLPGTSEGCHIPRLLGCYEHELHDDIEALIAKPPARIINIGCADGYYAVGLAMRMPEVAVFAHDIAVAATEGCTRLAALNGVAARVTVGGRFACEDFAAHAGTDALLLMDVEGAERELLDPTAAPALRGMRIIVEAHEVFAPGIMALLEARFAPSHRIRHIGHRLAAPALPAWLAGMGHLDQLAAVWEWRSGPTPWLVMEPIEA